MTNPIKPTFKSEVLPILILAVVALSSFYFYSHFPASVPTHWNFAGEVDGYSSRAVAAFMIPAMLSGIYLLFLFIPFLDPKKERYVQFAKVYHVFKTLIVLIMAVIYFVASLTGIGYDLNISLWVPGLIGILFIFLGNYMGKIKPNWFMGIRTPWTMSSEEVWNQTHRFGGKVFMAAGVVMILMNFFPDSWRMPVFAVIMIGILFGTVGYSFFAYRVEEKRKNKF